MFQKFDSDEKGHLKPSELVELFKHIGYENFTEANMKEFIGSVEIVSFKEYLYVPIVCIFSKFLDRCWNETKAIEFRESIFT